MSGLITLRIRTGAAALAAVAVTATMWAGADTFYVNDSCGDNTWTGLSRVCEAPNGPKLTIQAGIDASVNGDTVIVADGTYMGVGNKNLDYGGRLITLRSENGSATCIIDCELDGRGFYFQNGETADAVLAGFTIRNGSENYGGAIRCQDASPTILNCVLANNEARYDGGGIYIDGQSSPSVTNCTFSGNNADEGGGIYDRGTGALVTDCTFSGNNADDGGGMYNRISSPTVTYCTFSGNSAEGGGGMFSLDANPIVTDCTFSGNNAAVGGAMINIIGNPTVTDCTFSGNSANSKGGAIHNLGGSPTVTDCTFSGNNASFGGGMYNCFSNPTVTDCAFTDNAAVGHGGGLLNSSSSPRMANCTFSGNSALRGGGMFNSSSSPRVANCTFSGNSADLQGGGLFNEGSRGNPAVTNCILWNNSPDEIGERFGVVTTVRFSDVQGGWPGTGNVNDDPRFVDPTNGNYRLSPGSPCIDAADNTAVPAGILTDLDGKPRFVDDPATPDTGVPGGAGGDAITDMGAYEFPCDPCDMNCDGTVDASDIEFFIDILFNGARPCDACTGDTNGDGNIDPGDIEGFIGCLFP